VTSGVEAFLPDRFPLFRTDIMNFQFAGAKGRKTLKTGRYGNEKGLECAKNQMRVLVLSVARDWPGSRYSTSNLGFHDCGTITCAVCHDSSTSRFGLVLSRGTRNHQLTKQIFNLHSLA
jgi:hypothetical protein